MCCSPLQQYVTEFQLRSQPWAPDIFRLCALTKRVHGIQLLNQMVTSRHLRPPQLVASKAMLGKAPSPRSLGNPNKDRKDNKEHKKTSKRKKKRKHSSSNVLPSPISSSNYCEASGSVSPDLGDPVQFHRQLPSGKACAKMLVRAQYRCACHFLLLRECPSRGHLDVHKPHSS